MSSVDSAFSFRTNERVKNTAFDVIRSYGLTPSQVFNMLLFEIAQTKTIPLNLNYQPNVATQQAMQEVLEGQVTQYSSLEALHQAMQGE